MNLLCGMLPSKLKYIITLFCICLSTFGYSQIDMKADNVWSTLGIVTWKQSYNDVYGILEEKAEVSPIAMLLNGKEIEVEGYFIALSGKVGQSHFMLSALPQNICFFCGGAGPETAMQVFMKDGVKMEYSEKKIKVRGTLNINAKDSQSLLYTLNEAVKI